VRWDVAHRVASIAAVHAHRDYGIDRSGYVDVFAAIEAANIDCMGQPLPRLLGMYVAPQDDGPAILVNSGQDEIGIRHSASHELGHHVLGHTTCLDEDPFTRWGDGTWPDDEKTAEAFAAWFLMPPPAIHNAMRLTGLQAPRDGADAYQIARWLGTSYAGTVRHLVNVRLARPQQAHAWSRIPPGSLRRAAQGPADDPPSHVWVLRSSADAATAHVAAGDRLHLLLPAAAQITVPAGVTCLRDPEEHQLLGTGDSSVDTLLQVTGEFTAPAALTARIGDSANLWRVTLAPIPFRRGVADAWRCGPDPQWPDMPGMGPAGAP
jgi:Zn-dependent peptidase ImmA (M78 family)